MTQRTVQPIWIATGILLVAVAMLLKAALAYTNFTPSQQPVGYVAQLRPTSPDLRSNSESVFRTDYERDTWSGNVLAYDIDMNGTISATAKWDVGSLLNARTGARTIVTMQSNGSKIPFALGSLSETQQAYLSRSSAATGVANSQQVLDYLRGDRSLEGGTGAPSKLRTRSSRLGDIVHSRPFYVADASLANGKAKTASAPLPTLFVGSNDGMLHAFDASFNTPTSGQERWAYVPSMLFPKLSALADTSYAHDYYVDGSVSVGYVLSGTKRILVGALGAGGRGLYALDITGDAGLAPGDEATAASHIKWEITDTSINNANSYDYANLGYTYSNPVLGKVKGTDAVIVGNGYLGADGKAYLYIINADTGALIGTPIATDSQTGNGLSTPAVVDKNGDGNIDFVFAGDLLGRLWRFDVNAGTSKLVYDTAQSPAQPITMAPSVRVHPNGGYMVNFATGTMLRVADSTDGTTVYAAYGVWDGAPDYNTVMLTQSLTTRCFALVGTECSLFARTIASPQTPDWSAGTPGNPHTRGWMTRLPAGERVIGSNGFIDDGRFCFTAYNPTFSSTPISGAQAVYGSNYLLELDSLSGGVSDNRPFMDMNGDGQLTDADRQVWRTGDPATTPATSNGNPILTKDGVPVGYLISIGVMSQPLLVQLASSNTILFNQNSDVDSPKPMVPTRSVTTTTTTVENVQGVAGGHFDVDIYYGPTLTNCSGGLCSFIYHDHQYDDLFNVTGVNFLDPNRSAFRLNAGIYSTSTPFKVLVQNQYLSPSIRLNIGNSSYRYNVDKGYIKIKNYQTSPDITAESLLSTYAPTYTQDAIGSFAVNMPVNAFDQKDWWGGVNGLPADVRTGVHPTSPFCLWQSNGLGDGNMYQPVIPPSGVTDTGNGTIGYSYSASNNSGASGVRHNGALTFQLIQPYTPSAAVEQVVRGRPEYGWTVRRDQFASYVMAEYNVYWHYPNDICFGNAGWTKLAFESPETCTGPGCSSHQTHTDPDIKTLTQINTVVETNTATAVITVNGDVTTISYSDGYVLTITKTNGGTVGVSGGTGSIRVTTTTITGSDGNSTTQNSVASGGGGSSGTVQHTTHAKTGRISWRELIEP